METLSIPQQMRRTAAAQADSPAVLFAGHAVTFGELDRRSDAIAAALAGHGIRKGDRVALYCINSDGFAACYAGILKAGAVVVPVNLLIGAEEIGYVLNDAGVQCVIYHAALAERVAQFRGQLAGLAFCASIGAGEGGPDPRVESWLEQGGKPPAVELDPTQDLAAILYTSGTTGHPKGAMLTHGNLAANCRSVMEALQLTPGRDRLLVVLPMFHSFAATVGMLTPLLHGIAFAPVPRFDPALVSETIAATGATVFLGVPSMYSLLLRLPEEQLARWRSVRYGISGGAALPVEVMRAFELRFGFPILEGDGPTECGPVTCVNPLNGVRKPASVGLEIPRVEIAILDDEGNRLDPGSMGEICVRGPNVMKGYWNLPEATAESFVGDWFRTGDLGYKDGDGYIFMVDRKKDMVIVNGMNVYPRMVEEALYRHPLVAEAAVVGERNPLHGEILVAHVVLKPGAETDTAAIRAFCREHLGTHQVPRRVVFRETLPKNAGGKVLKRELRREGELERGIDG